MPTRHTTEAVSWIVVEAGAYRSEDGKMIQAGTKAVQGGGWESVVSTVRGQLELIFPTFKSLLASSASLTAFCSCGIAPSSEIPHRSAARSKSQLLSPTPLLPSQPSFCAFSLTSFFTPPLPSWSCQPFDALNMFVTPPSAPGSFPPYDSQHRRCCHHPAADDQ